MSSSGSGAAATAATRVSIPSSVRKTIENIKEITGNHSDEEIYAMLKECSMDPNETAQKLLFQDTFHEVKRKRDRRKENLNKESTEARWKPGMQGRGNRGGKGNYPSRYMSNDTVGGRNSASGKENGTSQVADKGNTQETKSKDTSNVASLSTVVANGPPSVASVKTSIVQDDLASAGRGGVNQSERTGPGSGKFEGPLPLSPPVDVKRSSGVAFGTRDVHGQQMLEPRNSSTSMISAPSSGSSLSASDPVLLPSQDSRLPGAVGTIRREASHRTSPEQVSVKPEDSKTMSASEIVNTKLQGKMPNKSQGIGKNQLLESLQTASSAHAGSSNSRPSSNYNNRSQVIGPQKGPSKEWKPKSSSSSVAPGFGTADSTEAPAAASDEANTKLLPVSGVLDSKEATLELQRKLEESHISDRQHITHISDRQHVIFPNHLHVPEAEKLGFCFGSFDASFGLTASYNNGPEREKSLPGSENSEGNEEAMRVQLLSNQNAVATAEERDYPDQPQSSSHGPENLSSNEGEVSSSVAPDHSEAKQEALHGGHQDPAVHTSPNYSFGFMPPIQGTQIAPFETSESQARDVSRIPNFVVPQSIDPTSYYAQFYCSGADSDGRISPFHSTGVATKYNGNVAVVPSQTSQSTQEGGNQLVLSTASPTPLVTQAAALQSSLAVSQQPLPVFRQPPGMHLSHYPTNYIPYGHYYSPFYIPPAAMHQFLSNGAFPQHPQAGSMYPPPPAATAKYSLPQYKPGTNAGNSTHNGATASYGPYGSSMSNYNPGSATTAGNQTPNDDLVASQFKESNVYGSGQQTEGSGVWITPPGREISSLHASSLYGLPQGQVAYTPTQPGHGTFAGIYHPAQPVTAAAAHPLLQQSQTMAGPVDMVGPTATVYQQPQQSQMNWPSNY